MREGFTVVQKFEHLDDTVVLIWICSNHPIVICVDIKIQSVTSVLNSSHCVT